jgi:prepilin-type processing-associated H-X9-DG protein
MPPAGQLAAPQGRSNYFGNLGTNAWVYTLHAEGPKDPTKVGNFAHGDQTRIADITDGTSNTALFAEVKRGNHPVRGPYDVTLVSPSDWPVGANPGTDPINVAPPAACNTPTIVYSYTGLEYQRGFFMTALYTHTVPPNYTGRDCLRLPVFDQGHLAARSYHPGGVNVAVADGSVRFVTNSIQLQTWRALGTRAGGEIISAD